jgi:hypothetical protein
MLGQIKETIISRKNANITQEMQQYTLCISSKFEKIKFFFSWVGVNITSF